MKDALSRRSLIAGTAILAGLGRQAHAIPPHPHPLAIAARSPFLCSSVALTPTGAMFLGLPHFPGMEKSPSLVRVENNGTLTPFPGGAWNTWTPGQDGSSALVMVNAIHIFRDGTLWVVDQGALPGQTPQPNAQKLVQFDPAGGKVLQLLRFPDTIMPPGAQFNDLRIHGDLLFVTDSGLGGVIIHNLATGQTLRRLSGQPVMCNDSTHIHRGRHGRVLQDGSGKRPQVQSDMLEVDATGQWFWFSVPAGPLKRIPVASLLDLQKNDEELAQEVQVVAEIPSIGGTCIDTLGNIYLSDAENARITVLAPNGRRAALVSDPRLLSPDALFIDRNRTLYIPCPQLQNLAMFNGGHDTTRAPFLVLKMPLPKRIGAIPLGDAVEG
ncbi:SMP-30/gluconolactonase/LRE family protein [Acetobacter sp.]|uniref:SMP-30/gluconolactonase/LRE family protein n=1 Tax=Acetobacter sp. TaxID=440 RepID=UPI0039E7B3A6